MDVGVTSIAGFNYYIDDSSMRFHPKTKLGFEL